MRTLSALTSFMLVSSLAAAGPLKIAVVEIEAGTNVPPGTAGPLTEAVVAEVRKTGGTQVLTQKEIMAVLTLEQQKQLMGCATDDCRAQVGNVLGVDRLLLGDLSKLGESWLLHLKLLDVRGVTVVSQVDRRQRGGNVDDLLDALPALVGQLMAGEKKSAGAPVSVAAVAPVAAKKTLPPLTADVPVPAAEMPKALKLLTDGKGQYFAYDQEARALFRGDGKTFFAARITGGSRNGADFDFVFWEPRVRERWRGGFGRKSNVFKLWCGETVTELQAVSDGDAAKMMGAAKFHGPKWQRMLRWFGRDDLGNYYLVDQSRAQEGKQLRLYVGRKGALTAVEVDDVISDADGDIIVTPTGRLKISVTGEKPSIEWIEGQAVNKLKFLDVEDNAQMIYTELGVYKEPLGTPCDGRL